MNINHMPIEQWPEDITLREVSQYMINDPLLFDLMKEMKQDRNVDYTTARIDFWDGDKVLSLAMTIGELKEKGYHITRTECVVDPVE